VTKDLLARHHRNTVLAVVIATRGTRLRNSDEFAISLSPNTPHNKW
jgi:hypothetical protein